MALKDTIKYLRDLLFDITQDLSKAEGGNKAASQRVRTGTVKLEKLAKIYRKESIKSEKNTKPAKKAAKKTAAKPKAKATTSAHKPKAKAHALKAHKTVAKPKTLSFKRPSAKLPTRRVSAR